MRWSSSLIKDNLQNWVIHITNCIFLIPFKLYWPTFCGKILWNLVCKLLISIFRKTLVNFHIFERNMRDKDIVGFCICLNSNTIQSPLKWINIDFNWIYSFSGGFRTFPWNFPTPTPPLFYFLLLPHPHTKKNTNIS